METAAITHGTNNGRGATTTEGDDEPPGRHLPDLPAVVLLASMVYQALASTQFLAVLAVLAVNLVGATLVVAVDERLSRKAQHGEAQDRPVW
jgi:hypothetical protein